MLRLRAGVVQLRSPTISKLSSPTCATTHSGKNAKIIFGDIGEDSFAGMYLPHAHELETMIFRGRRDAVFFTVQVNDTDYEQSHP